jgi:large subunit ribosomal protein L35
MPKMKTHKGAKRRFKVTATGKVMHRKGSISHLRLRKSARAKRGIASMVVAADPMQKRAKRLLP